TVPWGDGCGVPGGDGLACTNRPTGRPRPRARGTGPPGRQRDRSRGRTFPARRGRPAAVAVGRGHEGVAARETRATPRPPVEAAGSPAAGRVLTAATRL